MFSILWAKIGKVMLKTYLNKHRKSSWQNPTFISDENAQQRKNTRVLPPPEKGNLEKPTANIILGGERTNESPTRSGTRTRCRSSWIHTGRKGFIMTELLRPGVSAVAVLAWMIWQINDSYKCFDTPPIRRCGLCALFLNLGWHKAVLSNRTSWKRLWRF